MFVLGRGLGSGGILQSFGCQDQKNGYPEEVEEKTMYEMVRKWENRKICVCFR